MKEFFGKIWRVGRWVFLVVFVLYVGLVGYRIFALGEEEKTAAAVAKIHVTRLTMADVAGENLPPEPNPAQNDSTLAGIDVNGNGIRDDVELAIFEKYKGRSFIKERAAALQYAKELQMEFTEVFNSETLVAVIQEESRGYACVQKGEDTIENLVLNTDQRKQYVEELAQKYMKSYALPNTEACDLTF